MTLNGETLCALNPGLICLFCKCFPPLSAGGRVVVNDDFQWHDLPLYLQDFFESGKELKACLVVRQLGPIQ
ncbi:MAG: hypothetical protein RLZZ627_1852, partial [Pseudomonadota bacterium]